jgi:hypothetical protein
LAAQCALHCDCKEPLEAARPLVVVHRFAHSMLARAQIGGDDENRSECGDEERTEEDGEDDDQQSPSHSGGVEIAKADGGD